MQHVREKAARGQLLFEAAAHPRIPVLLDTYRRSSERLVRHFFSLYGAPSVLATRSCVFSDSALQQPIAATKSGWVRWIGTWIRCKPFYLSCRTYISSSFFLPQKDSNFRRKSSTSKCTGWCFVAARTIHSTHRLWRQFRGFSCCTYFFK